MTVNPITKIMAAEGLMVGSVYSLKTLDKGMHPIPGVTKQAGVRFHHTIQDGVQFKTYEFFISQIFHFIFSHHS